MISLGTMGLGELTTHLRCTRLGCHDYCTFLLMIMEQEIDWGHFHTGGILVARTEDDTEVSQLA